MEVAVSLETIAKQIQDLTKNVSTYLQNNGHPQPSLSVNGPADFPRDSPEVAEARGKLIEQTQLLRDLLMGPSDYIRHITNSYVDVACIHWITHFNIAKHVPLDQPISYADLASAANVPLSQLRQVLRYASTIHLFTEPTPGHVAHTSVSRLLRDSPPVIDYVGHCVEFSATIVAKMVEATEKFQGSQEPNETAFNLAFDTPLPMFGWMGQHPEVAQRFKRLMVGMTKSEKYSPRYLGECYDWSALESGKVVDIGGSSGHCSIVIAKQAPKLKLIVQDLPHVVAANKDSLPEELRQQISFMPHDFFAPQPVEDADVYLFSQIFHDWSDKYCVKILQNVIPVMKKGAKIVIRDQVVPPPGSLEKWVEKEMRMVDIFMMTNFNAKERELSDWEKLFAEADPRLRIAKMVKPPTSVFTIMEIELREDGNSAALATNGVNGSH
ncbi:S-adenosyl-L-methionine-dependent methyltransferase [Rhizodiscina lignyota]|uniref:S-adenosyl-L-methionine-dependent methyltransferase n=1 Tax=Rhizodiscina lignyota TaxID=1504668 RepID=A0A9P4M411_9PEZI|nr:S-adenosyl-L-methionine-dependent methyltransferase [Rhizodiscina lignyota]